MSVEQTELRRRLKAARVLRDLTVQELLERIPPEARIGVRTYRKWESGESELTPPILRELAVALELPYEWFTAASVTEGLVDNLLADRLRRLERQVAEMRKRDGQKPQAQDVARP